MKDGWAKARSLGREVDFWEENFDLTTSKSRKSFKDVAQEVESYFSPQVKGSLGLQRLVESTGTQGPRRLSGHFSLWLL